MTATLTRGGVVYWRRVAAEMRAQADEAACAGDRMLVARPARANGMYQLARSLNVAARKVELNQLVTPEEHALVDAIRARVESAP